MFPLLQITLPKYGSSQTTISHPPFFPYEYGSFVQGIDRIFLRFKGFAWNYFPTVLGYYNSKTFIWGEGFKP